MLEDIVSGKGDHAYWVMQHHCPFDRIGDKYKFAAATQIDVELTCDVERIVTR